MMSLNEALQLAIEALTIVPVMAEQLGVGISGSVNFIAATWCIAVSVQITCPLEKPREKTGRIGALRAKR